MSLSVLKCPQCSAPLTPPSKFARSMVCPYCSATVLLDPSTVSTARFKEAYRRWNAPEQAGFSTWFTIGESRWSPGQFLAYGMTCDVYVADRARFPSERVLLKVARETSAYDRLHHEFEVLQRLHALPTSGAFLSRIPEPVAFGRIREGTFDGYPALALRWASGFRHTFEKVRSEYPQGLPPIVSIWVWRRILEVLAFLHQNGFVHGAVHPPHLLVEDNEHGVRLVGYGKAGQRSATSDRANDIAQSALSVAYLLGSEGMKVDVPSSVPASLSALLRRAARHELADAWRLRE